MFDLTHIVETEMIGFICNHKSNKKMSLFYVKES